MGVEKSLIKALNVPEEKPSGTLGPSREFYEKHGLTFINNVMGLSCLFFLTTPAIAVWKYSELKEQSAITQIVVWFCTFTAVIQTILSVCGDYWLARRRPETDQFILDRIARWIQGRRERLVVTGPHHITTWKRLWVANTLDVCCAVTMFLLVVSMTFWQLSNGSPVHGCVLVSLIAVICKTAGEKCWKGMNGRTYTPEKVWWFNVFHTSWHFFVNVAILILTKDICTTGLHGL